MPRQVDAIVVNYNSGSHLKTAVDSLLANGVDKVWIVDNSSKDGSSSFALTLDPKVTVLDPKANLGYGRGVNFAFEFTDSKFIVICNPDIEVTSESISYLIEALEQDSNCGLVGPRILNLDGTIYPSVRHFPNLLDAGMHSLFGQIWPNNPFTRRYRMLGVDHSVTFEADWVSGAVFMMRSADFKELGGFNPKFFMYLEDVYLCRTVAMHGKTVKYCSASIVHHAQGVTTAKRPLRMIFAHHKSLWIYARLTKSGWQNIELLPIGIGIFFRFVISVILAYSGRSLKKPKVDLK